MDICKYAFIINYNLFKLLILYSCINSGIFIFVTLKKTYLRIKTSAYFFSSDKTQSLLISLFLY